MYVLQQYFYPFCPKARLDGLLVESEATFRNAAGFAEGPSIRHTWTESDFSFTVYRHPNSHCFRLTYVLGRYRIRSCTHRSGPWRRDMEHQWQGVLRIVVKTPGVFCHKALQHAWLASVCRVPGSPHNLKWVPRAVHRKSSAPSSHSILSLPKPPTLAQQSRRAAEA